MKIKICDRCKKLPDQTTLRSVLVELQFEGLDMRKLDWWVGKKESVDICESCLNDFWNFITPLEKI